MPLIINSGGKVELITPDQKILRSIHNSINMPNILGIDWGLGTATGEALDRLSSVYGVQRKSACVPSAEGYGGCDEETDEALRTRIQCIVRGYV